MLKTKIEEEPPYKRRVSRLCLTPHVLLFISTLLYFTPYLFQHFDYITPSLARANHSYSSEVGAAVLIIVFLLGLITFAAPGREQTLYVAPKHKSEAQIVFYIIVILGLYVLFSGHALQIDKKIILDQTNRLHLFFYQTCSMGFIFSALIGFEKNRKLFLLSLSGLLLTIYIGHRSSFVIAIIGLFYIRYRNSPMTKNTLKFVVLAGALLFALSVYKSIYVAVKIGNWDLVLSRLSPENLAQSSLIGMEQFVTFAHLDFVVRNDFRLECTNIWMIPISVIPFVELFIDSIGDTSQCYYNAQVQPVFFSGYRGGVAANIWAEFFGYLGYVGFPVLIAILSGFFWLIEYFMRRARSPILISGLIMALVYMSFYIQRKELFGAFISAKRSIIIALIIYFIAGLLRKLSARRRMYG